MDVAVDADDAGSLELVRLARAATVETEVEPVAGREREEVVGKNPFHGLLARESRKSCLQCCGRGRGGEGRIRRIFALLFQANKFLYLPCRKVQGCRGGKKNPAMGRFVQYTNRVRQTAASF